MSIIIGADFVPSKKNEKMFINGDIRELFGDNLINVIYNSTYRIFNLEMPLTNNSDPIHKCGTNLVGNPLTINAYRKLGVDILTLANNHILDQNVNGLKDTEKLLDENNIKHIGAGSNLDEASKPIIFENSNKKVGLYTCCEHEFSIATKNSAGANPYDPLLSFDHIKSLKEKCDYVIVLFHGGKEHYQYPSPNLQKIFRKFADCGANVVIAQHTHCIGCMEKYNDSTLIYGQGNFLFADCKTISDDSLLVKINDDFSIEYIPITKLNNVIRLGNKETVMSFMKRSEDITKNGFIDRKFHEYANFMIDRYLLYMSSLPTNRFIFKCINKITGYKFGAWLVKKRYNKNKRLAFQNYIECESHSELLIEGLKENRDRPIQ